MKIDVTQGIKNWDGSPFKIATQACPVCRRPQESEALTLRKVCLEALGATLPEDRDVSAEIKFARFDVGMRIQREDTVELTVIEIANLQERINKFYFSSLVVPQAHRMLEAGES